MKKILLFCSILLVSATQAQVTWEAKTAVLPNNIHIEYVEQGKPKGLPVILLHGFTDSWYSYSRVLPFLPPDLHVCAITMRGHGNSSHPANGYLPKDFAGDIAAFMKAMRIGPAIIVGHSFGSLIAQQIAIDHPRQVQGLVLIGTFAHVGANPLLKDLQGVIDQLKDPIDQQFVAEFQKSTVAQPVPTAFMNTVVSESMKVPAHVWKSVMEAFMPLNNTTALKQFSKPTLIVRGALDELCPRADQDALVQAIKGAQYFEYEKAGHGLHWEEPEKFAFDLTAFSRIVKNNR